MEKRVTVSFYVKDKTYQEVRDFVAEVLGETAVLQSPLCEEDYNSPSDTEE